MKIEDCRQLYADGLRYMVNLQSDALWRAFAAVPRERFLGPGRWLTLGTVGAPQRYRLTPDDDPAHVYHDVLIALDSRRGLNNGQPSSWAYWLDAVAPQPGEQIVHIGCGTGYYSAVLGEVVAISGSVIAFEIDPGIAERAKEALKPWGQIQVVVGDGALFEPQGCDLVVVSAGVSKLPLPWINGLAPGGRLLVPMTVGALDAPSQGRMLRIGRTDRGYAATSIGFAGFYPCIGTQHEASALALTEALRKSPSQAIKSLRLDAHEPDSTCWLHDEQYCLSTRALLGDDGS